MLFSRFNLKSSAQAWTHLGYFVETGVLNGIRNILRHREYRVKEVEHVRKKLGNKNEFSIQFRDNVIDPISFHDPKSNLHVNIRPGCYILSTSV